MLARVRPVAAAKSSAVAGQIEAATNSNSKRAGELMARHCGVPQKSEDSEVVIDFAHSSGEQHSDTSGIQLRPRARDAYIFSRALLGKIPRFKERRWHRWILQYHANKFELFAFTT